MSKADDRCCHAALSWNVTLRLSSARGTDVVYAAFDLGLPLNHSEPVQCSVQFGLLLKDLVVGTGVRVLNLQPSFETVLQTCEPVPGACVVCAACVVD